MIFLLLLQPNTGLWQAFFERRQPYLPGKTIEQNLQS